MRASRGGGEGGGGGSKCRERSEAGGGGGGVALRLGAAGGDEAAIRYFLDLVAGRAKERVLTAEDARDSIAMLLEERKSSMR